MIVQLLYNAFYIEANCEEPAAPTSEQEQSVKSGRVEAANDISKTRHGRTTFVKAILANPSLSSAQILAQKFANDALKSPKVQETIRVLSDVRPQKKLHSLQESFVRPIKNDVAKLGTQSRNYHKSSRHQRPRKKKRKRHKQWHKRFRSDRPRSFSKRKYNSMSKSKLSKKRGFRKAVNQVDIKQDGSVLPFSTDDEKEFVEPLTIDAEDGREIEGESMVQRLMRTTTKDPTKKSPGDQGIEYSEYYDDDVLGEEPVNKVHLKLARAIKNPSVRFARQTANVSSFYDYQLGNNYLETQQPYFNEDPGKTDFRYDDDSFGIMKNIPSDSNSLSNLPDYGLTKQRDNPVDYSSVGITESPMSDSTKYLDENGDTLREPQAMNYAAKNRQINEHQRPQVSDSIDTMQQPFGKVLESLGISVNGSSRSNVHSHGNGSPNVLLNFQQPMRKIISKPSAGSQNSKDPIEVILAPNMPRRYFNQNVNEDFIESNGRWANIRESEPHVEKDFEENIQNGISPFLHEQANYAKPQPHSRKSKRTKNGRSSLVAEERANATATVKETKEVANQILNRIMDELEELKVDRTGKNEMKEGVPCKLTGSWKTSQAGVVIDMRIKNHSMAVTLAPLTPEPARPGLINATWNVTGNIPFKRGAPFFLFATDNYTKTLAIFVGACRVCQGIDTIEGVWSIAREPKDCRDFPMAIKVVNDVFRRIRMLSETKQKLQTLIQSCTTLNSTSTTLSTTEITTTVPKKET